MSDVGNSGSNRNIFDTFFKLVGGTNHVVTEESKIDSKQCSFSTANSPGASSAVVTTAEGDEPSASTAIQQIQVSSELGTPSKSFYSSTQLSEALRTLPPGQFEAARDCCMRLRYPPTLAVLMQREKGNQLCEPISSGPQTKLRSVRSIHFEILPSHFEGTVVKLFDEDGATSVGAEDVVEEDPFKSESINRSAVIADGEGRIPSLATSTKRARHQRKTKVEEDSDFKTASNTRTGGIAFGTNGDDSDGLEIVSVLPPDEQLMPPPTITTVATGSQKRKPSNHISSILSPSAMAAAAGTSSAQSSSLPPLQQRVGSSQAINRSSFGVSPELSVFQSKPSNRSRKLLSFPKTVSFSSKCLEGCLYLDKFYQQLVGFGMLPEVALEMTSMAVSSDFLVPTPCPFGWPHFVCLESNPSSLQAEQFLLMGDALRLILLAYTNPTVENRNAVKCLTNLCHQKIRSILVENIRVRTPEGFQCVPLEWSSLLSSYSLRLPSLLWLPVVTPPSRDVILRIFNAASKSNRPKSTVVPSWTSSCPVEDLAHIAVALCPKFTVPDPLNPPTSINSTVAVDELTSAQALRDFLSLCSTPTIKWTSVSLTSTSISESPLETLIHMTPPQLRALCQLFDCNHASSFAGLGLICLLFKRLFMHLFVNASLAGRGRLMVLRHTLCLIECPLEDAFYDCDLFTHLATIHARVSDCLGNLRTAYPQLVSAGACLTAQYRLNYSPQAATTADVGRSRLFTTAQEARDVILQMFKETIYPNLVALFESVAAAHEFLNFVLTRDLYMFRRSHGIDGRVEENNAFRLLRSGIAMLNRLENKSIFQKISQSNDGVGFEKILEPAVLCKTKLIILRPPGLLYLVEQMAVQLKTFRHSLMTSRMHLSSSWWSAFTTSAVDVSADSNVKLFVTEMQTIFDTIESWTRGLHNVELRSFPAKMLEVLVKEMGKEVPGLRGLKVAPSELELLGVPYGSKNSATAETVLTAVAVASLPPCPQNVLFDDGQATVASEASMSLDLLNRAFSVPDDEEVVDEGENQKSSLEEGANEINEAEEATTSVQVSTEVEERSEEPEVTQRTPPKRVVINVSGEDATMSVMEGESKETQELRGGVFTSNFFMMDRRTLGKLKRSQKILSHHHQQKHQYREKEETEQVTTSFSCDEDNRVANTCSNDAC
ncbi:conserved hypothetical protein [Echinococcus multilocularis]|uniref:Uncharacterized protein n=1 Tax=Echinococcus multilocularis TaxID=6211 RepID=A0A068XZ17_ECHMU|nr:conserved hypothetical protein [Echinococcus multilocularis]